MISALSARDAGRVIEAKGMYMVKGRAWLVKEYPKACAELRANEDFVAAYERFEVINRDILDLFTRWQTVTVAGQPVPNDHTGGQFVAAPARSASEPIGSRWCRGLFDLVLQ